MLLRHLSEVYKVLAQTVPPALKTEELEEAETFFEDIVRGVDSSLLDEWERLRNPGYVPEEEKPVAERKAIPITRNRTSFTRSVRGRVFDFVRELSRGNLEAAVDLAGATEEWHLARLSEIMADYPAEHGRIRLDPEARNAKHCSIRELPETKSWRVEQVLVDQEELNDWSAVFNVDLEKSDAAGEAVLSLSSLGQIADD